MQTLSALLLYYNIRTMKLEEINEKQLYNPIRNGRDKKYLENLIDAFKNVDIKYQSWKYNALKDKNIQNNERPFCYELYHQLRLKTKEEKNIILHGEINKEGITKRDQFIRNINSTKWDKIKSIFSDSFIPDLVLHEGQDTNHPDSHHLYIEVKAKPSRKLKYRQSYLTDILKCLFAIEAMGYSYGVFICLNISKETQFKIKINKILRNNNELFDSFNKGLKKLVILYRSKEEDDEIEFYQIENNNNQ